MRVLVPSQHPTPEAIWRMLVRVGRVLGVDYCVRVGKLYEFYAGEGRLLRLTPESADRARLDLWQDGSREDTLWRPADDLDKLAQAVAELRDTTTAGRHALIDSPRSPSAPHA